ncbi:MAG: pantoate--beta-alanine ligase [Chloroflexi bacterium]|nr:pantoate--beta-alanine ligase [Chloroflexota bacterium]
MDIVKTFNQIRQAPNLKSQSVGLVPTMGALHQGHLALIRTARLENDVVVATIFVNPSQFDDSYDLANYPRNLGKDLGLLEQEGVDIVYLPSDDEIYPEGFDTWIEPGPWANKLEGVARPGHFRGVSTVVTKLFNQIQPNRAYFGQKDGQQVAVIKHLVLDLNIPVEIRVIDTVREPDGLALSSRNNQLTPQERLSARLIYKSLLGALELFRAGEMDADKLRDPVFETLLSELKQEQIEYITIVDPDTFEDLQNLTGEALILVSVRFGKVRLIDNLTLS